MSGLEWEEYLVKLGMEAYDSTQTMQSRTDPYGGFRAGFVGAIRERMKQAAERIVSANNIAFKNGFENGKEET